MNRNSLICALLTISISVFGQVTPKSSNPDNVKGIELDPLYFILGTLSDYMGRLTYVDKSSQVDRYYGTEKPLMAYLVKMINRELNIDIKTIPDNDTNPRRYETFSPELSSRLNSFFDTNYLIIDNLENVTKLNRSYLAGRYYRYGKKINDSIYSIQISNSADHKAIDSLLRRDGCTKIHFRYKKNIPAQFIYYFIPNKNLKKYFDSLSREKKELENFSNQYIQTELNIDSRKLKSIRQQIQAKDYDEIINLFNKNGL